MTDWYRLDIADAAAKLASSVEQGLSGDDVHSRQVESGPNELAEPPRRSTLRILWQQLSGPLMLLLVAAAVVSLFLNEIVDAIAILVIVVLNAALGFYEDFRAERAMASLKRLAAPSVRVRRDGNVTEIASRELVPGDMVLLEAGSRVPADGRVVVAAGLQIEEAILTGESEAVQKDSAPIDRDDVPLGDRRSMAYMGTVVRAGRGEVLVTAIGMDTELGHISGMLQAIPPEKTPLQGQLAKLAIVLSLVALGCVGVVVAVGLVEGASLTRLFMTGLSLAVAIVPEGLPAVATVTLALGSMRMLRRHALIRELPAVETLGAITAICADKTGTITENVMTLDRIETMAGAITLRPRQDEENFDTHPDAALLLLCGTLCNDATITNEAGDWTAVGDPTECAFLTAAAAYGAEKDEVEQVLPRLDEVAFDTERKCMTTLHHVSLSSTEPTGLAGTALKTARGDSSQPYVAFTKGAVHSVLDRCTSCVTPDGIVELSRDRYDDAVTSHDSLASGGRRVLALAYRLFDEQPAQGSLHEFETELTFIGLAGLHDPPRPEAAEAVQRCKDAGIRPIMITGDHALTAESIAAEIGIQATETAVTGETLGKASDQELASIIESATVYARVSPEHKLRIVEALRDAGAVVCMTGDGANDAPALKRADIGVAMGITGTDVARDAAEMVLLDDNFATIVNAVEEGRRIYDNIRKFLRYTMTSNAGEVGVMLVAPLVGMPLPLLPLQILWINLVTDGLPGLALALEPAEKDVMKRPPRDSDKPILDKAMVKDILWIGTLMSAVSLGAGYAYWRLAPTDTYDASWGTIVFTVLTLSQMGNALAIRSRRESLLQLGLLTNWPLLASVLLTLVLQLAVVYLPPLQAIFQTQALGARDLVICLALSTVVFAGVEASKWIGRRLNA